MVARFTKQQELPVAVVFVKERYTTAESIKKRHYALLMNHLNNALLWQYDSLSTKSQFKRIGIIDSLPKNPNKAVLAYK